MDMVSQGVLPAAAEDLRGYENTQLGGERGVVYAELAAAAAELKTARDAWPDADELALANYASQTVKPLMEKTRVAHDKAEKLINKELYPCV